MRRSQTKQTFKLHMLAFVLTLAIAWYTLNPTTAPVIRRKRDEELPDEKKRKAQPQIERAARLSAAFDFLREEGAASRLTDEDNFEWPDLIDG